MKIFFAVFITLKTKVVKYRFTFHNKAHKSIELKKEKRKSLLNRSYLENAFNLNELKFVTFCLRMGSQMK